jgi:hypothetical protein
MKKEKIIKPETLSEAEKKLEETPSPEKDALAEEELDKIAGGVSPRDAASGLPTGQRMHKPY